VPADVIDQDAALDQLLGCDHRSIREAKLDPAVKLLIWEVTDIVGHAGAVPAQLLQYLGFVGVAQIYLGAVNSWSPLLSRYLENTPAAERRRLTAMVDEQTNWDPGSREGGIEAAQHIVDFIQRLAGKAGKSD
jgi:hypothetical protein